MRLADLVRAFPPEQRTFPAMLQQQAQRYCERLLFKAGTAQLSFDQVRTMAARFAGTLSRARIRRGDRAALMCSNRAEFMRVLLGCTWLGAIAVPINVASRGMQLQHILKNCGARLLVIEADLIGALDHVDIGTLALEQIWLIGDEPPAAWHPPVAVSSFPPPGEPVAAPAVDPSDTAAILYTSGTTGPSKGVCCPHAQYFWWGANAAHILDIREGDVLLTTLPLFHVNALGSFFQAMLTGSMLVVEPRFSASHFWDTIIRHDATITYLLGAMVPILLSREPCREERAHRIRTVLAPGVPAQLHSAFEERTGIRLIDGYGSTETNFVIGSPRSEQRPGYMGKVAAGFDARVVDESGNDVAQNEPGELILRSQEKLAFATGYFAMPEATAAAWADGWFHTGDRVVRDALGYFRFIDRMKDSIRRRGENISSYEVEQVLLSHPDVANAAVFPVRSQLAEDEVMAAVVRRHDSTLDAERLTKFCAPRLPYFAVPRFIEFVDELPATESGKVQKYKLRERGISPRTWDREAAGYRLKSHP
jgi:crotonobetaine/carnitine-CoA ligase